MNRLTIFIYILISSFSLSAQEPPEEQLPVFFEDDSLIVFDQAAAEDGYYLFVPKQADHSDALPVTVFLHGYGGLNPMIYGKWIRHISLQGHMVIYPRYQEKILKPAPTEFVPNTTTAIHDAFDFAMHLGIRPDSSRFYLAGHSYGAVVAANLAARYDSLGLPLPKAAFICEPGTGPFSGAVLDDYSGIPKNMLMTIIVGMQDGTVGQKFGEYLFDKTAHLSSRALIYQHPSEEMKITASHYEPYSLDTLLDNGDRNFTAAKSLRVSRLNEVDKKIYWPIFDLLVKASEEGEPAHMRNILWPMIYGLGSSPAERALLDIKY